jgi:DNA-binding MarR family transcriptional regulator
MSAFNPEKNLTNIDYKIVAALEKISEVFRVLLWAEAKEHKVSPIQLQLLIFLRYHKADARRRIAFMAREFNLTKATISDSIKVLEQKGLVQRIVDTRDSRSFNFSLTDKGQVLTDNVENFTLPLDTTIETLELSQKKFLLQTILDVIYKLNQKGIISTQRMCFNCGYYGGDQQDFHFCNLMQAPLAFDDLRFDCPEHLSRQPGVGSQES